MKRLFTKNKNHSRMFLSGISSLENTKAVETPDTDTRGWTKVLSKDTSARHHKKSVAHSVVIPQCRSLHRHPAML